MKLKGGGEGGGGEATGRDNKTLWCRVNDQSHCNQRLGPLYFLLFGAERALSALVSVCVCVCLSRYVRSRQSRVREKKGHSRSDQLSLSLLQYTHTRRLHTGSFREPPSLLFAHGDLLCVLRYSFFFLFLRSAAAAVLIFGGNILYTSRTTTTSTRTTTMVVGRTDGRTDGWTVGF